MSTETTKINKKISLLKKLIELYTKLIVLKRKQKPVTVILHHSATDRNTTRAETINKNHRRDGYPLSDIGKYTAYNVLIEGNGDIYWGRSLNSSGRATGALKKFYLDVCLIGNFEKVKPRENQLESLRKILKDIEKKYNKVTIKGHKDFWATLCPGKNLYKLINQF